MAEKAAAVIRDTRRQTAAGKVLWHFTMSVDGFVAGPEHRMDWLGGFSVRTGLIDEYVETTGAILGVATGGTARLQVERRMAGCGAVRSSCSPITRRMRGRPRASRS